VSGVLEALALFVDRDTGAGAATSGVSSSASTTSVAAVEEVAVEVVSASSLISLSFCFSAPAADAVGRTSCTLFCDLALLRCAFPRAVFFGIVTHSL
jgi:hypothetical protein